MTTCASMCTATIRYTGICRKPVVIESVKERLAVGPEGLSPAAIARRMRDALAAIEQLEDQADNRDYDTEW